MLKNILEEKRCFKLVCGAGNEDIQEIEKLVALYSKAGCNFFDLSANEAVIDAAKRGLDFSIPKEKQNEFYFCVSVGINGDPHTTKAKIDEKNCILCKKCIDICPQNAIFEIENICKIKEIRCIGCGKCKNICTKGAISFYSKDKNLKEILPPIIKKGIDCIELHAIGEDENEVDTKWKELNSFYEGFLSICIDRSKLGNEKYLARIERLLKSRMPYSTIIQADGAPMSGGVDDYKTTLQAIAAAEIVQDANLPAFLLISGGTNSKSTKFAKQCGINPHGITIGSYARQIVKNYIKRDDFLQNERIFNEALNEAKKLVKTSLDFLLQ